MAAGAAGCDDEGTGIAAGVAGRGVGEGCAGAGGAGPPDAGGKVPSGADVDVASSSGPTLRVFFANTVSAIDVEIKIAAKITVVRVNTFAAPRPVMRPPIPPPPPIPSPPPSERCSRITPIIAMQTTTSIVSRTAYISGLSHFNRYVGILATKAAVCSPTCGTLLPPAKQDKCG